MFDDLLEDYFSVVGSTDESEPEHGLTDDSDSDDGDDKHNEGGWFNFDDLDNAEFSDDEDCDAAICSNAVDHSTVTLPRTASSMPASLAAVHPVVVPQEEGVTS